MKKFWHSYLIVTALALCASGASFAGNLADSPLSLKGSVPPNVLFDLSVEFPTAVTAAYFDSNGYTATNTYLGLFDSEKCYSYSSTNQYFSPISLASSHSCSGTWSGNFLNWASMTGLDEFRYAMTGGNRYIDNATTTVLERTYMSNQGSTGSNFPNKTFDTATTGFSGSSPYAGGTTRTIANLNQGVQMSVTYTATSTSTNNTLDTNVTCTSSVSGTSPYCNTYQLSNSHTATCAASPVGSGTSASPYRCGSFNNFSGGEIPQNTTVACTSSTNKGTAFSPKYVCNKYSLNYTTTTTTTSNVTDNYYVRVKVCDPTVGLESNCKQFGSSGSVYKPTGVVQDNGEKMRFGMFSYYNSSDVDNAVMRSKLKYVAPQKYSSSGGTVSNPNAEWDSNGILLSNPDPTDASSSRGGAVSSSGLINYINQFGKASSSYKTYDNVGKLYYESLRYLMGLQPTSQFYSGATLANGDGFPVVTNWDDPQQFTCQKNYIIAMGDTHTWCDKQLPGGSFTSAGSSVCNAKSSGGQSNNASGDQGTLADDFPSSGSVSTWTNYIGTQEGLGSLATTFTGVGNASFYMAGLAYWAAANDIRDATKTNGLGEQTVKTFVIDVDEAKDCGYNSQYWLAAKYGGADSFSTGTNGPVPSGNLTSQSLPGGTCNSRSPPGYNSTTGVTYTSWPKTYLQAGNPAAMIAAVRGAIQAIDGEIGNESALAQSSGDLRTGSGAYIYRAIYSSAGWTGDVQSYFIDTSGAIASSPTWTATANLPAAANRNVLTFNDGLKADGTSEISSNAKKGVAFDPANFTTNFSSGQQAVLNRDSTGTVDSRGSARVSYLRGDQTKEGSGTGAYGWRTRTTLLGDIINSNPIFVGAPPAGLPGNGYGTYAQSIANRKPMIYVGGNDGMLHGFDATQPPVASGVVPGKELIAYVPSAVYSNLNQLMSPSYSHKYFVDGSAVVSEACFGTCGGSSNWKTILVGGLNAGGQGVYALNVTDPSTFATASPSSLVLWEFTDKDDRDLGYTFSKPIIRKMNNGKWAVIFGNGFNNTFADSKTSSTGRAYLYILPVDGPGAGNPWVLNTNYYKIELKSPSEPTTATLPLSPPNGLASVAAIDKNQDGIIDYVYGGDRQGNLWKIDVSDATPSNWKAAFGTTTSPQPLFTAVTPGTPVAQGITTGLEVSAHPNGGYMLLFGTGSYIEVSDPLSPFKTESYYGIWDKDDGTQVSRSQLQPQAVLETVTTTAGTFLFQSQCVPNYTTAVVASNLSTPLCPASLAFTSSGQQRGWVFDLPDSGERVVSDKPLLQSSVLTFTTLTPSADPCTGNTIGREYNINYLTGGAVSGGVFDLNGDGVLNSNDLLPVNTLATSGATGNGGELAASGKVYIGGARDTPIRLVRPRNPPAAGSTASCSGFIPGWGCYPNNPRLGHAVSDVSSSEKQKTTTDPADSSPKVLSEPVGRLNWRQIIK